MRISIIAAMGKNRAIGRDGGLPWRLPADMRFFKKTTMGHHLVMGRRTWDELGAPLPGRTTIVISRDPSFAPKGAVVARSLDEALQLAAGEEEVFVAGGAVIYALALPVADRMVLTLIDAEFEADTFFPAFDEKEWEIVAREDHPPDEKNRWPYSFTTWERKSVTG
jgi:dihydrofolate reductase